MKTIILFRHAKAAREHEAPTDRQRRLTTRGHRDAEAAGAALLAAGLKPDYAVISDAMRTRETAHDALRAVAPLDARIEPLLYLAQPEAIWHAAMNAPGKAVVVIGHNPGMHALVAHLVEASYERAKAARDAAENMPTAAWAAFEIAGDDIDAPGARFLAAWRPAREEQRRTAGASPACADAGRRGRRRSVRHHSNASAICTAFCAAPFKS